MPKAERVRGWSRFHLSTAVILMLAAAGLLWLNMQRRFEIAPSVPPYFVHFGSTHRGWPFDAIRYSGGLWSAADYAERDPEGSKKMLAWKMETENVYPLSGQGIVQMWGDPEILAGGLLGDIVVALSVLVLMGLLVEWLMLALPRGRKERHALPVATGHADGRPQ